MRAIRTGAPMRPQVKAHVRLLFENWMTAGQRQLLRALPKPLPVRVRQPAQPRVSPPRARPPRRPVVKDAGKRYQEAWKAIRRGPPQ